MKLNLKYKELNKEFDIKDDYLFNSYLVEHPTLIKRLIHSIKRSYKISDVYFEIVNKCINLDDKNTFNYPGLIVRVNIRTYAVLYLENTETNDDVILDLISEYIYDKGDVNPVTVNIDKFEITKDVFLNICSI